MNLRRPASFPAPDQDTDTSMSKTVSAEFASRRDAETAVEHLVQEHGVDRNAVTIGPVSDENSAGTEAARADVENGRLKRDNDGQPALAGRIRVSAEVAVEKVEAVEAAFRTYGG